MASVSPGIIGIQGTLNNMVFVRRQSKHYVRKVQEPGLGKKRPQIMKQANRTAGLNRLASQIHNVFKMHTPIFYGSDFYHRMQKQMRRQPLDNRFLLLHSIKNMEVNTSYPFQKLNSCKLIINDEKKYFNIKLTVEKSPDPEIHKAECYEYELLLFSWNKTNDAPAVEAQLSPWISMKKKSVALQFSFPKINNLKHWALFVRIRLGYEEKRAQSYYVPAMVAEGIQLLEVGTTDPKDLKLLEANPKTPRWTIKPIPESTVKSERKGVFV